VREDLNQIVSKLDEFERRMKEIMALLPERGRLIGVEQSEAQSKLGELKDDLEQEAHRRDFSQAEEQWYSHAVWAAMCHIHVKRNSVPDQRWREQLYDAKSMSLSLRTI
jgi:2'-5' RNA ligase